jgi:hypothetical protein
MANYNKKSMKKPASNANIGRLASQKKAIDPNPAGRTVIMNPGQKPKGMKKGSY